MVRAWSAVYFDVSKQGLYIDINSSTGRNI